jgi:dolichol-phosphate mannosyltransferase
MKKISIIIPCYNEETNILHTYNRLLSITSIIKKYVFEFIFIDNGSVDNSRKLIEKLARKDKKITAVFLSRNFGPEASTQAGVNYATGDAAIIIWCDLQDPPELIPIFISHWEKGSNIVIGLYNKARDNFIVTFLRKLFYKIYKAISNIDVPINATGFGLIDRKAINAIRSLPEKYWFFRGLRSWIGFKTSFIKYDRNKRKFGKSSYNLYGYIKHSERGVFGFSYLVLDVLFYSGFILVFLSFLTMLCYVLLLIFFNFPIQIFPIILLLIFCFGSIQLLAIGIVGKYIEVTVEETKNRPVYIVDKIIVKNKLIDSFIHKQPKFNV